MKTSRIFAHLAIAMIATDQKNQNFDINRHLKNMCPPESFGLIQHGKKTHKRTNKK